MEVNHVTYNTRNNVPFSPADINKGLLFQMKNFVDKARKNEYAELIEDVKFNLTEEDDTYVSTLFYDNKPFLVTYGARSKSKYVWDTVLDLARVFLPDEPVLLQPESPYVLDLLLPFPAPLEIYDWTADFTKCLFWYLLTDYKEKGI